MALGKALQLDIYGSIRMVNWLRKEVAANRREMEDDALVKHLQVTLPTINPLPTPTPPGPATSLREQTLRSLLRLIDSCITQLKAQGPSRACNESKEEEEVPR